MNQPVHQQVSKEYSFEMAHRLTSNLGGFYPKEKCGSLHGHSVKVKVTAQLRAGKDLDQYGFVTDFSDFKVLKKWINSNLDHATLVCGNDHELIQFLKAQKDRHFIFEAGSASSETIAKTLFAKAQELLNNDRIEVVEVKVSETCTSEAVVKLSKI